MGGEIKVVGLASIEFDAQIRGRLRDFRDLAPEFVDQVFKLLHFASQFFDFSFGVFPRFIVGGIASRPANADRASRPASPLRAGLGEDQGCACTDNCAGNAGRAQHRYGGVFAHRHSSSKLPALYTRSGGRLSEVDESHPLNNATITAAPASATFIERMFVPER